MMCMCSAAGFTYLFGGFIVSVAVVAVAIVVLIALFIAMKVAIGFSLFKRFTAGVGQVLFARGFVVVRPSRESETLTQLILRWFQCPVRSTH